MFETLNGKVTHRVFQLVCKAIEACAGSFTMKDEYAGPYPFSVSGSPGLLTVAQDIIGAINEAAGGGLVPHGEAFHTGVIGDAPQIRAARLAGASYDDIQDIINLLIGSAIISGGVISDSGGGQIDVSAGSAIAKITDTEITTTQFFDFGAEIDLSLTDNSVNYIYADYNAGTPQIHIEATGADFWTLDMAFIGTVYREGTTLHINNIGTQLTNFNDRVIRKSFETQPGIVQHAEGIMIGSSGRYITVTAGIFWAGHARQTYPGIDTSGTDRFSAWYNNGSWQEVTSQAQIDNVQYNDYGTGLANVTPNQYGVHWVYSDMDAQHTHVVYGIDSYSYADAIDATPPVNLPPIVADYSFLIGKVVIERDDTTMETYSPFAIFFGTNGIPVHNNLSGLQGGTVGEYYHLTSAEHAAIGYPPGYLSGGVLGYKDDHEVRINRCYCRDEDNTEDIVITSNECDLDVSGLNGLDTGTVAADTWYSIWVIRNPTLDINGSIAHAGTGSPTMPSGYTKRRRIGWIRTDSTPDIWPFKSQGGGLTKTYMWDNSYSDTRVLNAGGNTSFTNVDLSDWVPPSDSIHSYWAYLAVWIEFYYTGANIVGYRIRPDGNTETSPQVIYWDYFSHYRHVSRQTVWVPTGGDRLIEYALYESVDELTIWVYGWKDSLALPTAWP